MYVAFADAVRKRSHLLVEARSTVKNHEKRGERMIDVSPEQLRAKQQ